MKLQVLVSTMHQTDHSLLERMNIQSDAVVVNQCDENCIEEFTYEGHKIKWYSLCDRGVGLSRNTALMHADADVVLFADDDVVYEDGYADAVLDFFKKYLSAKLATFNLQSLNSKRPEHLDTKTHKLRFWNCLRYGAFRIAVRRDAVVSANIFYSLLFGGGAPFQAGEDNLFLTQCLQKGLCIYAVKTQIGTVKQEESTWFSGYNEKYYHDRGALFAAMYGKYSNLMICLIELKNCRREGTVPFNQRLQNEFSGIRKFKKTIKGKE